jgi:hypothetical protein
MAVVVYKTPGAKESGFDHIEPLRLEEAIAYAESAKKAYQRALSEHTLLPNALPWVAIPMAAAALGLGISGISGDPITALGLTTAAGLALGQWVQNKPREALYNLGFNAITCLLQSIAPWRFTDSGALRAAFMGERSLGAQRAKLAADLEVLRSWIVDAEGKRGPPTEDITTKDITPERITAANALLQRGKEMFRKTEATNRDGFKLYVTVEGAAYSLVQNVDQVISKVNTAIRDTQPSVQALASVVRGLGVVRPDALKGIKGGKVPGAPEAAAKTEEGLEKRGVRIPEGDVERDIAEVAGTAASVQQQIDAVQGVVAPSVATCLAVADTPGVVLRLSPPGDVELTQGETRRIATTGGKPPYFPAWLKGPKKGPQGKDEITATRVMEGSAFYIELTAAATASRGEYELHISDSSTAETSVKVTLNGKTEPLAVKPTVISLKPKARETVVITGGDHERYKVLVVPDGVVTAKLGPYDPQKGQELIVEAGEEPKECRIVIVDESQPDEARIVTVKVDKR